MRKSIGIAIVFALALVLAPTLKAQTWGSPVSTVISAVGGTTTGTYPTSAGIPTSGATAVAFHVISASTSSATLYFEQSLDGTNWYRSATVSNPTSVGELWVCPAVVKARINLSAHASGTISAFLTTRTMAADPIGSSCKKIDVADAGSTFSLTSPTFGTQVTLDQTTGDYTLTWANPAAARAIGIVDPGGTDYFVWRDATQTLTNKTLTTPVIASISNSGTITVPTGTDTLVARDTTDTLTNKTLTSPTLTTPSLGVATATSVNKVAITAPATGSTLTIADGDTLTVNGAITLTGTDSRTYTFPSTNATVARTDAAQTFAGAQTYSGSFQGGVAAKALVAATPTIVATVSVASGGYVGGFLEYSIQADDATDFQARSGVIPFSAVNKAGTITCTVGTVGTATEVVAVSAGTLTNTWTCADATGNVMNLLADAASSLTETTLQARALAHVTNAATVAYP